MQNSLDLAEIGALLGDPARATMLEALTDGRALTAKELAYRARVTPQTASLHLKKLNDANLLSMLQQGRNRYFRLASPLVAQMIEAVGAVAAVHPPPRHRPTGPRDAAMREARICYDHLAGRIAVELAAMLVARGFVVLETDGGEVTDAGAAFLRGLGIDIEGARSTRRSFCRPCLDWSERRFHIGGAVGAALTRHFLASGWIARTRDSRAVSITQGGQAAFRKLGIGLQAAARAA